MHSFNTNRGRRGSDRMVVGFTSTYAISAYHQRCCECESRSGWGVIVCQWLATGRWFSPGPPVSSTNKTDRHDISEKLLKVALNTTKQIKILIYAFLHYQIQLNLLLFVLFFIIFNSTVICVAFHLSWHLTIVLAELYGCGLHSILGTCHSWLWKDMKT